MSVGPAHRLNFIFLLGKGGLQNRTIYIERLGVAEVSTDYSGVPLQQEVENGVCKVTVIVMESWNQTSVLASDSIRGTRPNNGPFSIKGSQFNHGLVAKKGTEKFLAKISRFSKVTYQVYWEVLWSGGSRQAELAKTSELRNSIVTIQALSTSEDGFFS